MVFVNRDFNTASNIRECAVLKTRSVALWHVNFGVGQPPSLELYKEKLRSIPVGRSTKPERRLRTGRLRRFVWGAQSATTVHGWRKRFSFGRRLLLVCGRRCTG
jgi:hypothetical protein